LRLPAKGWSRLVSNENGFVRILRVGQIKTSKTSKASLIGRWRCRTIDGRRCGDAKRPRLACAKCGMARWLRASRQSLSPAARERYACPWCRVLPVTGSGGAYVLVAAIEQHPLLPSSRSTARVRIVDFPPVYFGQKPTHYRAESEGRLLSYARMKLHLAKEYPPSCRCRRRGAPFPRHGRTQSNSEMANFLLASGSGKTTGIKCITKATTKNGAGNKRWRPPSSPIYRPCSRKTASR